MEKNLRKTFVFFLCFTKRLTELKKNVDKVLTIAKIIIFINILHIYKMLIKCEVFQSKDRNKWVILINVVPSTKMFHQPI